MSETTHTPTPWRYVKGSQYPHTGKWMILGGSMQSDRSPLASIADFDDAAEADAALIVRAVNAHDALVKALEAFARAADEWDATLPAKTGTHPISSFGNLTTDHLRAARYALALAKGEAT